MGVGKADAFPCDAVDIGCLNARGAVTGNITVSQVVGVNDDDVRTGGAGSDGYEEGDQERENQECTVRTVHGRVIGVRANSKGRIVLIVGL